MDDSLHVAAADVLGKDERTRLLESAAGYLDGRATLLGGGGKGAKTAEGALVRMFAEDRACLGRPEVLPLDPDTASDPAEGRRRDSRQAHYWVSLPVSLWSRATKGFNLLEVKVSFRGAGDVSRQPTIVDAVPHHELVTRFKADSELSLSVGADFKFEATLPEIPLEAIGVPVGMTAGVATAASTKSSFVLSPRPYTVQTPVVMRSGLGLDHVLWRLERESFVEENDPGLRLIIQIPRPAKRLEVSAQMVATRYPNLFAAGLRRALEDLPSAIREFFSGGTPIAATGDWDVSESL